MNFKNSRFPKKPLELLSVQEMDELSAVGNVDERQEVEADDIIPILDVSSSLPNRAKKITAGQLVDKFSSGGGGGGNAANRTLSNLTDYPAARSNLGLGSAALADVSDFEPAGGGVGNVVPLPAIVNGDLYLVGEESVLCAELDSYEALSVFPKNFDSGRAVLDWPQLGGHRSVSFGKTMDTVYKRGLLVPDSNNILHIVIGLGQSLMVGSSSASTMVSTTPVYPDEVLMFNSGINSDVRMGLPTGGGDNPVLNPNVLTGFLPLRAVVGQGSGARGETPMEGFANALQREALRLGVRYKLLNFTAAQGGSGYFALRKGTQIYANMLTAITKAKELAEGMGWRVVVDGCILRHGESNSNTTNYLNNLLEWQSDIDTDVKAITGQDNDVHFIMAQPSSFFGDDTMAAPLMTEAHINSSYHHLSAPDYPLHDLYFSDYLHGTGPFYYKNGEYLAIAFAQALWSSEGKSDILRMTSAERTGTSVDVVYTIPTPPLQLDTNRVSERDTMGFRYVDSNGEVEVTNVEIASSGSPQNIARIELTLGSTPSGSNEEVWYAMSGHGSSRNSSTIPRGNVRDSSPRVSTYDGLRLFNWAVHQKMPVTVA